jgi:hypothetical protein
MRGAIPPLPVHVHGVVLVKHRDNFGATPGSVNGYIYIVEGTKRHDGSGTM